MEGKLTFPNAENSDGSRNITLLTIQPCEVPQNSFAVEALDYITWCLCNSELFHCRKKIM